MLEFLEEEFAEKLLSQCVGNIFYIGDLSSIFIDVFERNRLFLPDILPIIFQAVFVLVGELSLFT